MKERLNICPKCGYKLLAREGNPDGTIDVICLGYTCNWRTPAKRESDVEIPDISKLKADWQ